ncbi:MAG TPA: hypothetical protein VLL27_13505 [Solirubrobacterales bacterium]|nr:hypothetical protein [Solirubrobacterales bacterium]
MIIAGLLAGLTVSMTAPSARAEDELGQTCVEAGLARPGALHAIEMHRAGLRPGTPGHYHSQGVSGVLLFGALPEGCVPSVVRTATAQIQMWRGRWVNVGARHGNMEAPGNSERATKLFAGPTHAWPSYVFNECGAGGKWLKVRAVVGLQVKDSSSHAVLGAQRYVWPVQVHGSCRLARISKKQTASYKEEWGQGSGRVRVDSPG